jgi:hypothetical protein
MMSTHSQGGPAVPISRPEYFQNVASGTAHVGAQIGKNTGTVSVGRAVVPDGVEAELHRLADALRQAHHRGQVDTETLTEAEHELDATRSALSTSGAPDRGRAIRALRRLSGMMDGIAGLGAMVGSVVAAIEGMAS